MKQANIGYANVEETAVLFKMCCSILFMHGKIQFVFTSASKYIQNKMYLERFCFLFVVIILNVIKGKLKQIESYKHHLSPLNYRSAIFI